RRDEERARLETITEAAKHEAEVRAEDLARLVVEFETRAACAAAGMDEKVAKVQADAAAETARSVAEAVGAADRKAVEAVGAADRRAAETAQDAERRVGEAAENAERRVCEAVAAAGRREEEADRRVSEAEEALQSAKAEEAAAKALADAALGRQRDAEVALRILARFVGPLHRLCLELREQKRFLSRTYRRDSPLQASASIFANGGQQAELFAIAAAVSDKDYWCLLSSPGTNGAGPNDSICGKHNESDGATGGGGGGGGGGGSFSGGRAPVHVPPSLRAVVIAVVAANRLTAFARFAAAARDTFFGDQGSPDGGDCSGPGAEVGVAARAGPAAGAKRRDRHAHHQRWGRGVGGTADARYLARAGGVRSLPVLPPWCCGPRGRALGLPAAEELEGLPDGEALEAVLARLLVFGGAGGGGDGGDEARNRGGGGG
ncbi:unnamed protein product, partial [Hapterophycus canaliculatus]